MGTEKELDLPCYIVRPNSKTRICWDILASLAILFEKLGSLNIGFFFYVFFGFSCFFLVFFYGLSMVFHGVSRVYHVFFKGFVVFF